jgi:hypothetical protein
VYQVEMAVPLSPQEVRQKRDAIFKHQSQKDRALLPARMLVSSGSVQRSGMRVLQRVMTSWDWPSIRRLRVLSAGIACGV